MALESCCRTLKYENLSASIIAAQIFQVRQQESEGIQYSAYRKTVLTHFEEKREHQATYNGRPDPATRTRLESRASGTGETTADHGARATVRGPTRATTRTAA